MGAEHERLTSMKSLIPDPISTLALFLSVQGCEVRERETAAEGWKVSAQYLKAANSKVTVPKVGQLESLQHRSVDSNRSRSDMGRREGDS